MGSSPFLNEVRASIRLRGMSLRTEKTYIYWIRNYIRYHNYRHPRDMGPDEVMKYLGYLAVKRQVAINTQKIALNAIAFLYNQFLEMPLGDLNFTFASRPRRLPEVLNSSEVGAILRVMKGRDKLIFSLLFGSGLRITECLRLRVKDLNFSQGTLTVRDGKGGKDRVTILSPTLRPALEVAIPSGIVLPLNYLKVVVTSVLFRSFSGITMLRQHRYTPMYWEISLQAPLAPWIFFRLSRLM